MRFDMTRYWYRSSLHIVTVLLLPFSCIFGCVTALRRWFYRIGLLKTQHFSVPVLVVGNITVGGTGKTPLVIWLANFLQSKGFKPGIVSRGVGAGKKIHKKTYRVNLDTSVLAVGDEAILMAKKTGCPVVVGIDRVAAVHDLLAHDDCDIVISDDGLQHYRLGRDIEIAVVDAMRQYGNHFLLPAGPLRESLARLNTVDFVVVNGGDEHDNFSMQLEPEPLISITNPAHKMHLAQFPKKFHAVAGIGNPERFFRMLRNAGFDVITHVFPDHYLYQPHDFHFDDSLPILMTEKDAVKCITFANERFWYLPIAVKMDQSFQQQLLGKCHSYFHGGKSPSTLSASRPNSI